MADVSNRTVVALLAVALVVTVAGTLVSVSKLSTLGGQYSFLTGAATTGTGTTSLTSDYEVSITLEDNAVSFGTGHVVIGQTNASVTSDGTYNASTWVNSSGLPHLNASNVGLPTFNSSGNGSTQVNQTNIGDYMTVQNNGNVDLNLSIESTTTAHAEAWLCGTTCDATASAMLLVLAVRNESAACDEYNISANRASNTTWQELLTTGSKNNISLCGDLDWSDTGDNLNVYFQAYVPSDATNGAHSVTLTYTAISRSSSD